MCLFDSHCSWRFCQMFLKETLLPLIWLFSPLMKWTCEIINSNSFLFFFVTVFNGLHTLLPCIFSLSYIGRRLKLVARWHQKSKMSSGPDWDLHNKMLWDETEERKIFILNLGSLTTKVLHFVIPSSLMFLGVYYRVCHFHRSHSYLHFHSFLVALDIAHSTLQ